MKRENNLNFEQSKNYYIQRNLRRFIQIDKKLLEKENKKNFIIVHSEEDFNRKCKDNNQKDSSIHFLKLSSGLGFFL